MRRECRMIILLAAVMLAPDAGLYAEQAVMGQIAWVEAEEGKVTVRILNERTGHLQDLEFDAVPETVYTGFGRMKDLEVGDDVRIVYAGEPGRRLASEIQRLPLGAEEEAAAAGGNRPAAPIMESPSEQYAGAQISGGGQPYPER